MNSMIRQQIKEEGMTVKHVGGILILKQGRDTIMRAKGMKEIGAMMRRELANVREIERNERARISK